jgi:hypothetical protein
MVAKRSGRKRRQRACEPSTWGAEEPRTGGLVEGPAQPVGVCFLGSECGVLAARNGVSIYTLPVRRCRARLEDGAGLWDRRPAC